MLPGWLCAHFLFRFLGSICKHVSDTKKINKIIDDDINNDNNKILAILNQISNHYWSKQSETDHRNFIYNLMEMAGQVWVPVGPMELGIFRCLMHPNYHNIDNIFLCSPITQQIHNISGGELHRSHLTVDGFTHMGFTPKLEGVMCLMTDGNRLNALISFQSTLWILTFESPARTCD